MNDGTDKKGVPETNMNEDTESVYKETPSLAEVKASDLQPPTEINTESQFKKTVSKNTKFMKKLSMQEGNR